MDKVLPVRRSRSSAEIYEWPEKVKYSLLALGKGPGASQVESGEALYYCILDMQRESGFSNAHHMARFTSDGISLFFDDLLSRSDAKSFFHQVLPWIAKLSLSLPALLQNQSDDLVMLFNLHSRGKDPGSCSELRPDMGLKLLRDQQRGIVVLSQHLVASLLACSFLCLYPSSERRQENLPHMNMDRLFVGIYERGESIEHKLLCLLHYFERVSQDMPDGVVSFERKVIPLRNLRDGNTFWSSSTTSLCPLKVVDGSIEDLGQDCLQVDFANRMLGGGALGDGCVQEEIRFMINPELAAGMVFLPVMASNESIEIVGAERYCCYTGYASSFRFNGDHRDVIPRDAWGRRRTHIIAIDALSQPGDDQFRLTYRMRELTKAFCGFLNSARLRNNAVDWRSSRQSASWKGRMANESEDLVQNGDSQISDLSTESPHIVDTHDECSNSLDILLNDTTGTSGQFQAKDSDKVGAEIRDELGIATGNWGCGVFGGNLPLKCMLQWLAASQAGRPYLLYFSFQNPDAQRLQEVTDWILQEGWVVGELWSLVSEYASNKKFSLSLFDWILPLPETELHTSQLHLRRHGQREVVRYR